MNKIILTTGAGQGLGLCITKQHLQSGDVVYALDRQLTDELKALQAQYTTLHIMHCDLASDESVKSALCEITKAQTYINIIYNVAGIFMFDQRGGITDTDMEKCMIMYNVNALGCMRLCKEAWPLINSDTVVMIISSESGSLGAARRTGEYGYGMSKAALNMGAKLLSNELWHIGARVMCIHPGWMRTSMGGDGAMKSDKSVSPEQSAKDIIQIALDIDSIPRDQMYMTHEGIILPW